MMARIEHYEKTDIVGQSYLYELHLVHEKWEVWCWNIELAPEGTDPRYVSIEHHWDVRGVTVGYKDDNPNRPIQEPFTEETARKEFERWRN